MKEPTASAAGRSLHNDFAELSSLDSEFLGLGPSRRPFKPIASWNMRGRSGVRIIFLSETNLAQQILESFIATN